LQDFHTRISNAIDSGYVVDTNGKHINIYDTVNGLDYLGNMIQGNSDSVNQMYYGYVDYLYKKILGMHSVPVTEYNVIPTALDSSTTNMRDPVFYGIYKNIVTYWMRYNVTATFNSLISL